MPDHPIKPALTASTSTERGKVTVTLSVSVDVAGLESSGAFPAEQPSSVQPPTDDSRLPSKPEEDFYALGYVPGPTEPTLLEREQIAQDQYQGELQILGLPKKYDLRDVNGKSFVTAVKSQLGCGSCVAFSVISAAESALLLNNKATLAHLDLSEAHLFFCHGGKNGRTCGNYVDGKYEEAGGWWPSEALEELKNIGVVGDDCYSYPNKERLPPFPGQRKTPVCSINPTGDDPALCGDWKTKVTKISGYDRISGPQKMKECLSSGKSALIASFTVYDDFKAFFREPKNHKLAYRKSTVAVKGGGHCVCVVGFDDNEGAGFWICKNSWGDEWADNGYFRIGYGQVGIDAYMYAINVS